ncbi:MAG: GNAT family N-acetyltransferase [Treponema sp.]
MQRIIPAEQSQQAIALSIFNSAHTTNIPGYTESSASIFDELFAHDSVFFLTQASEYAGFYAYRIKEKHAFLSALYVAAPYQRQGIGSYLLHDCEAKVIGEQRNTLVASVLKRSAWALNFYKKQHFTLYAESAPDYIRHIVQSYPDEPWAHILYKKLLSGGDDYE